MLLLSKVSEILAEQIVYFLDGGIGIALIHKVIKNSFYICRGNIAYCFVTEQRIYLIPRRTFTAVIGSALN